MVVMEATVNGSSVVGGGGESGGGGYVQGSGDSSEEELSVLPRHTKVVVTGNNRTKSVLVGLQGVVKKAVGLGGWHWLVSGAFLSSGALILMFVCFLVTNLKWLEGFGEGLVWMACGEILFFFFLQLI